MNKFTRRDVITKDSSSKLTAIATIVAIMLGSLTLLLNYVIFRDVQSSKRADQEMQLHNLRVDQLKATMEKLSEFRSLSYLYFFAEIASRTGSNPENLDTKHANFHRLDAELQSALVSLPHYFTNRVKIVCGDFDQYRREYPWEAAIQNDAFIEKVKKMSPSESVTDMISRAVFLDQFDALYSDLQDAMTKDITEDLVGKRLQSESESDNRVPFEVEYNASAEKIKVGDLITFTTTIVKGNQRYAYIWSGDENTSAHTPTFETRFNSEGTKIVNVTVGSIVPFSKPNIVQRRSFHQYKIHVTSADGSK